MESIAEATSVIPVFSAISLSLLKSVRAITLIVLGFTLFSSAFPAAAAEETPSREMTFSIVRASSPICEPDCPEWIAADGGIAEKTAEAFEAILEKAGDRSLPLLINSFGGRVDVAMMIGRLARERKMTIEVARTDYFVCEPWDKNCTPDIKGGTFYGRANTTYGVCNSACPLILAGGGRRIVSPLSRVGVHQIVTTRKIYRDKYKVYKKKTSDGKIVTTREFVERIKTGTTSSTELTNSMRARLEKYLTSMDINPSLIDLMLSAPPEDIRNLNMKELEDFGLATEVRELEGLVGYRVCNRRPRPGNCTVRK